MALKTQYIQIPLAKGVDTKTDEKLVNAPFFADLRNGITTKTGRVSKRPGHDIIGSGLIGSSTTLSNAEATGSFQNELMLFNEATAYSRSEQYDKYQTRGRVSPVEVTAKSIYQSGLSVTTADFAINQNISVYAFISGTDCYAVVTDESSGAVLGSPTKLNSSSTSICRVVDLGGYIYVFFYGATNIVYRRLDLSDPSTFEAETSIASATFGSTASLDVVKMDSLRCAFAFNNGSGISYGILVSADTPSISLDTSTLVEISAIPITLVVDPDTLSIWMCYYRSTTNLVRVFIFSSTLSTVLTGTNVTSSAYPRVSAIAGEFVSGEASPTLQLYFHVATSSRDFASTDVSTGSDTITITNHFFATGEEVRFVTAGTLPTGLTAGVSYYIIVVDADTIKIATSRYNAFIGTAIDLTGAGAGTSTCRDHTLATFWKTELRTRTITQTGTLGTQSTIAYGVDLRSKAFKRSDGTHYFIVGVARPSQFNYYLMDSSGKVIALCHPDSAIDSNYLLTAGEGSGSTIIQKFIETDDDQWSIPSIIKTSILDPNVVSTFTLYRNGISTSTFDFTSFNKYFSEEISNGLIISGGFVSWYDGVFVSESNFFEYPEQFFVENTTTGGTFLAGAYAVIPIYEWQDAQGNVHRSTPPSAISTTTTGSTSTIKVQVPNLHLTNRTSAAFPVRIAIYITAPNGSIYYKMATEISDPAVDAQIITLTTPPTTAEEVLYTDTGEVENIVPPPAKFLARNKNRVALLKSENTKEVLFSKLANTEVPINFNDSFSKRLDGFGNVISVAPLDDKFILFTPNTVHYWSGDGPNDTGEQDTFTDIQLVTTDTGLRDINSVVQTPVGIMFKSPKGIYILDRGLSLKYVGAPVEDYNEDECTSAVLVETKNQVIFTSNGTNPALVYDYYQDNWQLWDNLDAQDALTLNGTYHFLKTDTASIYKQGTSFKDGSVTYPLKIETPWIKLSTIQGFQRIRKMAVLGEFKSSHQLKVSIYYDYLDSIADIVTWNAGSVLAGNELGDETLLGDDALLGGIHDDVYQAVIHIPRQKCQAIKFVIEDVSSEDLNESYNLTHIELECALKAGVNKVQSDKTAGS